MKFVSRTCTESKAVPSLGPGTPVGLDELRDIGAYVLLGAPGSGKTTLFEREARETSGVFDSARDFTALDRPEWHGKTLFIDALDERRPRSSSPTHPLDQVRSKLDKLGRPRFRISCRDADWLGKSDWDHLKRVSPDGSVRVFHLDPLDQDGIYGILSEILKTQTPEQFVDEATDRGVERLLDNPLTLKLLVSVTSAGGWPASRSETYERACAILLRETNLEHTAAAQDRPAEKALLEAAEKLCAIQLMAGMDGYSLQPVQADAQFIPFGEVAQEAREAVHYALRSRLFVSAASGMTTVHRHVAEFLAGRYLAGRIHKGTPVTRVLALVTGYDGHVVSDLQGITAWLAVHCKESRVPVTERDPVGTLLYGDISVFTPEEKTLLVRAVAQHLERHKGLKELFHSRNPRLADLATPDMADSFRATLSTSDEDSTNLLATLLVLRALQVGPEVPGLADVARTLVRERDRHHDVRNEALDAYVGQGKGTKDYSTVLSGLLEEVWQGKISDPENELLGRLLSTLYPEPLGAVRAVSYLRSPKHLLHGGAYWRFWSFRIAEETHMQRIAELLDAFADKAARIRSEFEGRWFGRFGSPFSTIRHLPPSLLARYLESGGSEVEPSRLRAWLELISDSGVVRVGPEERRTLHEWLSARPNMVRSVFRAAAEKSARDGRVKQVVDHAQRLLLDSPLPPDFDHWCMEQSRQSSDQGDEGLARIFRESARTIRRRNPSISEPGESVSPSAELNSSLKHKPEGLLADDGPVRRSEQEPSDDTPDPAEASRDEWQRHTRKRRHLLYENRCEAAFLEGLAEVYFGNDFLTEGASPQERLLDLLGDHELVEAAVAGLQGTVTRDDLPTEREVLQLHSQGQSYRLALPFLAGMNEIDQCSGSTVESHDKSRLRLALAFRYTKQPHHPTLAKPASPGVGGTEVPRWYRDLLKYKPCLPADVLVRTVRAEIKQGSVLFSELLNFLYEGAYSEVARLASLPLLRLIPVRCTAPQLDGLEVVLKSALLYCDKRELHVLIEEKLGKKSMTVGQTVYWLAAGLFLDPSQYRQRLEGYVAFDEERIKHVVKFMAGGLMDSDRSLPIQSLDVESLEALVARGGRLHRPLSQGTQAVRASALIQSLVKQLGSDPSPATTEALERLLRMPELKPWHPEIRHSQRHQLELRRDSYFSYPSIEQLRQTLDNCRPASVSDLAALTIDRLDGLAREIRDGNASLWRQFWNVDAHGVPTTPRHEDRCRDLLLELLKGRGLEQLGVDLQREAYYSDDKRADIRASFEGSNIPIEIKKSMHSELWSSIRNQLVGKYTRDPRSEGYGIYLVLWFGAQNVPKPPNGPRPENASELRERLLDGLEASERLKISIVVIDVASPDIGSKRPPVAQPAL